MKPFFSVILPVYNVEPYLERCVFSVLQSDYTDLEVILVDDGSTDGSSALCDRIAARETCVRVIHKENGGLSSARNAGLEAARGQYIWWVDSDDWIEPDALILLRDVLENCPVDILKFSHFRVEEERRFYLRAAAVDDLYHGMEKDVLIRLAMMFPSRYFLSACTHVYRREFLLESGLRFVSERLVGSEDYLFNLEALLMAQTIRVIPDGLYNYEQRQGSLTQRYKEQLPQRFQRLFQELKQCFVRENLWENFSDFVYLFYVWHLMRGVCIPNEYYVSGGHTLEQGRQNVRALLKDPLTREAARLCMHRNFNLKKRVLLLAIRLGMEPLFYHLYVRKPNR